MVSLLIFASRLPVNSLGPAQLAAQALEDGFKAPVLDLKERKHKIRILALSADIFPPGFVSMSMTLH